MIHYTYRLGLHLVYQLAYSHQYYLRLTVTSQDLHGLNSGVIRCFHFGVGGVHIPFFWFRNVNIVRNPV